MALLSTDQPKGKGAIARYKTLLKGYRDARHRWETLQQVRPTDFDFFELASIQYDELRHSKILAWMLERRVERGTHGQGSLGFRMFLQTLGGKLDPSYADEQYIVQREVSCDKSRTDIEVAAYGKFIIHIETKILSNENVSEIGAGQTVQGLKGLNQRGRELLVLKPNRHALFLTINGDKPSEKEFRIVTWTQIASVADLFSEKAKAAEISLFTSHYARSLRKLVQYQQAQNRYKGVCE
jgi:hypothetical protein